MEYKIMHLPKEQWKGYSLPIGYTTEEYFDVEVEKKETGFAVAFEKKRFASPVTHTPEEYDFPDRLYEEYWPDACAWGIIEDGRLVAAIETDPEKWSNRLRVTELWVEDALQKKGIGHALMEIAKEQARQERRRAVILETQSCNVNAVGFYLHEGFTLIGMDTCCYSNRDLERGEVRMELGWFPERRKRLSLKEVEIRPICEEDWYEVERMTRLAFWNKHHLGCNEHLLVHKLRSHKDYLPNLSRIAVKDGEVIGAILYSKAFVQGKKTCREVLTFGPLCVSPVWQGCGVGEMLLGETTKLAEQAGYPGIVIFGEPDYYPRHGFKTCDHFGITTADGKNFDSFMGMELKPDGLREFPGSFHESEVFEDLSDEETWQFDTNFPPLQKQYFPTQWS